MKFKRLDHILAKGEGTQVEFKEAQGGVPKSLYETVVSFSNTDGGSIVLGVDDDGAVISISDDSNQQKYIQQIVSNLHNKACIDPPLFLQPEVVKHTKGDVIVLTVPASSQIHNHAGKIYFRSDDSDQDITKNQQKIADIFRRKSENFSEGTIYPYLELGDLDQSLFQKARKIIASVNSTHPWLTMDDRKMLRSASLYRKDFKSGEEGLTLAAALIFGKDETILDLIPGYKVDALVRKDNVDRFDDRLLLRTNLIDTYLQLLDFIKKHLDDRFYQENGQRKDLRELIFREVVGNLIVHREYTNAISTELIVYKEKVVATNPNKALFHGPLDPEQFNPYPKNPNIRKFFNAFGWTDELGSGVRNTTKYLNIYVPGAKPTFIEHDIFETEIPLVSVSLFTYHNKLAKWFKFSEEIHESLKETLQLLILDSSLNDSSWGDVLLHLVPSWTQNGTKLKVLKWPLKPVFLPEELKEIQGWDQDHTKILHKKTSYFIRTLLFSLQPVSLDKLMGWMGYSNRKTFRDSYLLPLQKVGFIEMTKPGTPKSPDQKYKTTELGKRFLVGKSKK